MPTEPIPPIVCCGHVCLDVIPRLDAAVLPPPGGLVQAGEAEMWAGGSVSNTGLALHRMGLPVRLVGRVGDDMFGREVKRCFAAQGAGLDAYLQVAEDEPTSYTVVISPAGEDRRFLHCPGVNDTFTDVHVAQSALQGAKHLHFGYPPLMRDACRDHGEPIRQLFERARQAGLTTSLDTAGVDPNSWAGRVDWERLLRHVLPHVDLFLPSRDELDAMLPNLRRDRDLLNFGCGGAVVKDGVHGLHVFTTPDAENLPPGWVGADLSAATFEVEVVGTTGAGDVTIAGFLAGFVLSQTPSEASDLACAAGAFGVQAHDAVSRVPALEELHAFVARAPPRRPHAGRPQAAPEKP